MSCAESSQRHFFFDKNPPFLTSLLNSNGPLYFSIHICVHGCSTGGEGEGGTVWLNFPVITDWHQRRGKNVTFLSMKELLFWSPHAKSLNFNKTKAWNEAKAWFFSHIFVFRVDSKNWLKYTLLKYVYVYWLKYQE